MPLNSLREASVTINHDTGERKEQFAVIFMR